MTSERPPEPRAVRRTAIVRERRMERRWLGAEGDRTRRRRSDRARQGAFAVVVVAVLAIGGYLAFGDFLGQRGATTGSAVGVQASMAGFTPGTIEVRAGEEVTLDFWTQDSSSHLVGGVHTMISEELGIHAELPGADGVAGSRVSVTFTAPTEPGAYDIYCDTCCGGRASPTMHGTIKVVA